MAVRDLRLMRRMPDIARLEMLELFHALARIRHDRSAVISTIAGPAPLSD
jgi:hypothetical protein